MVKKKYAKLGFFRERVSEVWHEPRQRRQLVLWASFLFMVLATTIFVIVLFASFGRSRNNNNSSYSEFEREEVEVVRTGAPVGRKAKYRGEKIF